MEVSKHIATTKAASFLGGIFMLILLSGSSCDHEEQVETSTGTLKVESLADNLTHPWALDFLPDGRLIITERPGRLRILNADTTLSEPLSGVPEVHAKGQGGLMDIGVDPDFETNQRIYIAFAEPGPNNTASTALGYGTLKNDQLTNFTVIFRQQPKVDGNNHFGNRIVFHEGYVFLAMGERFKFEPAQDLSNHLGTIIRLNPDGSIPQDNPFVGDANAADEIWSYGHRNIEAAAIDPKTNNFWVAEMGPQGGDELNLVQEGENYGWPEVSWGEHYNGDDIPDPDTRPEFTDAVIHWTPVISPSGMDYYTGSMFPEWQGHMLIGGLTADGVVVVRINGDQAQEVDRIDLGERTRDVKQAADGSIYVLTDENNGNILRLSME